MVIIIAKIETTSSNQLSLTSHTLLLIPLPDKKGEPHQTFNNKLWFVPYSRGRNEKKPKHSESRLSTELLTTYKKPSICNP